MPFADLTGAAWRKGRLDLHGAHGLVSIDSPDGLDRAWTALVALACPLPEFTRGHRRLGSRRGGAPGAQARILAPLLQARRRLQEQPDLEVRVSLLDARALRERLELGLAGLASDACPASAPDRRGLLAELEEAMEPLFRHLDRLEREAARFRAAGDADRFTAWRAWVVAAGDVFTEADRAWSAAADLLPREVTR
jgi:hypothetical protein